MFDELRQAFRQAVENFKTELNRDRMPEAVDRLVEAMRRELNQTEEAVERLKEEIRSTLRSAEEERKEAATCRRREELAREIDDDETVQVARGYAEKHEKRARVLERKALALREELELRESELEEMTRMVREADVRRADMMAQASRAQGRKTLQEADALFEELQRMSERVGDEESRAEAARAFTEEMADDGVAPSADGAKGPEVEERLRELKRRMGME